MRGATAPPATGWTSPSILLTIAAMLLATYGSYQSIQKDNSKQVHALEREVAVLKARLDYQCPKPPG